MGVTVLFGHFAWDEDKEKLNIRRHGISFQRAIEAFLDPNCLIVEDHMHSVYEDRWFCIGLSGSKVITVRFTYRGDLIRIFGAGIWRKERKLYEKAKKMGGS